MIKAGSNFVVSGSSNVWLATVDIDLDALYRNYLESDRSRHGCSGKHFWEYLLELHNIAAHTSEVVHGELGLGNCANKMPCYFAYGELDSHD